MKVNRSIQNNKNFGLLYMDKEKISKYFGPYVADEAEKMRYYLKQKADVVDIIVNPEINEEDKPILGVYIQDVTPRKSFQVKNPIKRFLLGVWEEQQIAAKLSKASSQKAEVFLALGNIAENIRNKVDTRLDILFSFRSFMAQFEKGIVKI